MHRSLRKIIVWILLLLTVLFGYIQWKIWRTEVRLEQTIARTFAPDDSTAGLRVLDVTVSIWDGTVRFNRPELLRHDAAPQPLLRDITLHLGRGNSMLLGVLPAQHVLLRMDSIRVSASSDGAFSANLLLTEHPIYTLALLQGDMRPERPVRLQLTAQGLNTPSGQTVLLAASQWMGTRVASVPASVVEAELYATSDRTTLRIRAESPSWLPSPGTLGQYEAVLQIFGVSTQRFDFSLFEAEAALTPDRRATLTARLLHPAFEAHFDGSMAALEPLSDDPSTSPAEIAGAAVPSDGTNDSVAPPSEAALLLRRDNPVNGTIRVAQLAEPLDNAIYNVERLMRLRLRRENGVLIFGVSGTLGQPRIQP